MGRSSFSSLHLRIFSAIVLIPLVLWIIWRGEVAFALMLLAAAGVTLYEWGSMARRMSRPALLLVAGVLYVLVSYTCYFLLREEYSFELTMACMIMVWASDSGAYFTGKAIGGPKLAPLVSPNKTWAGFFGAMAAPAIVALIWMAVHGFEDHAPGTRVMIFALGGLAGALTGVIGQGGDLLVSLMKRRSGLKDSGALIPGHGGILDRIDSLMPNAVFFYLIARIADYAHS